MNRVNLRQVWVDSESECSIIVEILERDENVEDPNIAGVG